MTTIQQSTFEQEKDAEISDLSIDTQNDADIEIDSKSDQGSQLAPDVDIDNVKIIDEDKNVDSGNDEIAIDVKLNEHDQTDQKSDNSLNIPENDQNTTSTSNDDNNVVTDDIIKKQVEIENEKIESEQTKPVVDSEKQKEQIDQTIFNYLLTETDNVPETNVNTPGNNSDTKENVNDPKPKIDEQKLSDEKIETDDNSELKINPNSEETRTIDEQENVQNDEAEPKITKIETPTEQKVSINQTDEKIEQIVAEPKIDDEDIRKVTLKGFETMKDLIASINQTNEKLEETTITTETQIDQIEKNSGNIESNNNAEKFVHFTDPAEDKENVTQNIDNLSNKQSKQEKKARKSVSRLGLKPVLGITRVAIKKTKTVLFVINKPDVFRNNIGDTYVIFGEAKVEDLSQQAQMRAANKIQQAQDKANAEIIKQIDEEEIEEYDENDIDENGIDQKDVELVMAQADCSRIKAVKALKNNENDIVNTIMELTM